MQPPRFGQIHKLVPMFTGIIEATGIILEVSATRNNEVDLEKSSELAPVRRLIIAPKLDFDSRMGDSIAVDGVCLTLNKPIDSNKLSFDISTETDQLTTLGSLVLGSEVNLERAVRADARLGGHYVTGHVDGIGHVRTVVKGTGGWTVVIAIPVEFAAQVVGKGSITLSGVSLTINRVVDVSVQPPETTVEVMLIPHTLAITNLKSLEVGQKINFETDLIAKHVSRTLSCMYFSGSNGFDSIRSVVNSTVKRGKS